MKRKNVREGGQYRRIELKREGVRERKRGRNIKREM